MESHYVALLEDDQGSSSSPPRERSSAAQSCGSVYTAPEALDAASIQMCEGAAAELLNQSAAFSRYLHTVWDGKGCAAERFVLEHAPDWARFMRDWLSAGVSPLGICDRVRRITAAVQELAEREIQAVLRDSLLPTVLVHMALRRRHVRVSLQTRQLIASLMLREGMDKYIVQFLLECTRQYAVGDGIPGFSMTVRDVDIAGLDDGNGQLMLVILDAVLSYGDSGSAEGPRGGGEEEEEDAEGSTSEEDSPRARCVVQ